MRSPAGQRPPAARARPASARQAARLTAVVVLPTPALLVGDGVDHRRLPGAQRARRRAPGAARVARRGRRGPSRRTAGGAARPGRAARPAGLRGLEAEQLGRPGRVGGVCRGRRASPRHSRTAPPTATSGAVSSRATGAGPRARATARGNASRSPAARCSERSATTRTLGNAADARRSQSALRRSLSTSVTSSLRPGRGERQPRETGAAADVHDGAGRRRAAGAPGRRGCRAGGGRSRHRPPRSR